MKRLFLFLAFSSVLIYFNYDPEEDFNFSFTDNGQSPSLVCDAFNNMDAAAYMEEEAQMMRWPAGDPLTKIAQEFQVESKTQLNSLSVISHWQNLNPQSASWSAYIYQGGMPGDPESGTFLGAASEKIMYSTPGPSNRPWFETRPLNLSAQEIILEPNEKYWMVFSATQNWVYFMGTYGDRNLTINALQSLSVDGGEWRQARGDMYFRINPCDEAGRPLLYASNGENRVEYTWSGYIEASDNSNPWDLSGDGSGFTVADGTPYSLSSIVNFKSINISPARTPGEAIFIPDEISLTIGDDFTQVGDARFTFRDNLLDRYDTIDFTALVSLRMTGTGYRIKAHLRLPPETFTLVGAVGYEAPPVFESAQAIEVGGGATSSDGFVTVPDSSTPVTGSLEIAR